LGQLLPILFTLTSDAFLGFTGALHLGCALGNVAFKEFFSAFFIVQEVMQELNHVVENKFMVVHARKTLLELYVLN